MMLFQVYVFLDLNQSSKVDPPCFVGVIENVNWKSGL